jgi:hypothetical protein
MTFVVFVAVLLFAFPLEHAVEVMRSAALTRMPRRGCMQIPFCRRLRAALFGVVHAVIGSLHQRVGFLAVARENRGADTHADRDERTFDHNVRVENAHDVGLHRI